MIINQTIGFTFIHIPKAAGTSLTNYLSILNTPFDLELGGTQFGEAIQSAYSKRYKLRKHSTLAEAYPAISQARVNHNMYIFTFVRNPYARLRSIFSFLRKWENYDPVLLHQLKGFEDFSAFVSSGLFHQIPGPDNIFRPQCDWLKINGTVSPIVRCFRIEDLDLALKEIREQLLQRCTEEFNLPDSFPHVNRSQTEENETNHLSPQALRAIEEFYAEDFSAFGYPILSHAQCSGV